MKLKVRDIALYALLIAMSLALSFLEFRIPISVPGIKLGLSNIITLYVVYAIGPLPAAVILFCRCLLSSFFSGVSSLAFSLCGGFMALFVMSILKKLPYLSIYGVSISGAAAHGIGQIIAACIMFSSFSAVYYLPLLLCSAIFTGSFIAFITEILIDRLQKMYKK